MTPRRWFRFRLRTMLIFVAALSCWLGYQLNWIRERHAFLETCGQDPACPVEHVKAPWPLYLFGEKGTWFYTEYPPSDPRLTHVRALFTEWRPELNDEPELLGDEDRSSWAVWPFNRAQKLERSSTADEDDKDFMTTDDD